MLRTLPIRSLHAALGVCRQRLWQMCNVLILTAMLARRSKSLTVVVTNAGTSDLAINPVCVGVRNPQSLLRVLVRSTGVNLPPKFFAGLYGDLCRPLVTGFQIPSSIAFNHNALNGRCNCGDRHGSLSSIAISSQNLDFEMYAPARQKHYP